MRYLLFALPLLALGCDDDTPEEVFVDAALELDAGATDAVAAPDAALELDAGSADAALGPDAAIELDAAETAPDVAPAEPDMAASPPPEDHPLDVVPDVPPAGPYGERRLVVPAATNWAATGLYLRAGETARISATGRWNVDGQELTPAGDRGLGEARGCPIGGLVARSRLRFEDAITCIGVEGEHVAPIDGPVYLGMNISTDLGEAYATRLRVDGELSVRVTSEGATVPALWIGHLPETDLDTVESGVVELFGRHIIVTIDTAEVQADRATAADAIETLDLIWEDELALRGMAPFEGQRVRFVEDETIADFAYMVAGNPIRGVPGLFGGGPNQRILRSGEPETDIWGFAHELGHTFAQPNGAWVYQINNVEVFTNIFTLHALEALERTENQPNYDTYCDGRAAWMEGGEYAQFKGDPFLQLCFLMDFTAAYGWDFWRGFFAVLNETSNDEIPAGGVPEHVNTWGWLRDTFSAVAGEDVTPMFEAWRVPLP